MLKLILPLMTFTVLVETLPTTQPPVDQRVHISPVQRDSMLETCKSQPVPDDSKIKQVRYCECIMENVSKFVTQDEFDAADQAADLDDFHRRAPVISRIVRYCIDPSAVQL